MITSTTANSLETPPTKPRANGITGDGKKQDDLQLKKACQDFEGYLLGQMVTQMFQSVSQDKSGLFGSNPQEEMFMGMFYQQLGGMLAKQGGIGLGDTLYQQLSGNYHFTPPLH